MKTAKTRKPTKRNLSPVELFFYQNAGYSYDPKTETAEQGRIRCAQSLARAEAEASERGWSFEWPWDESGCSGCDCGSNDCPCSSGSEHETLGCVLKDENGKTLESLWGICGATPTYSRVVEAELAAEALARVEEEEKALATSVAHMCDSTAEEVHYGTV